MPEPIAGKHILLGVTGSIAAYKAADLASKLRQSGALVDVILTEPAVRFVTPLTFQSVTGRRAFTDSDLWGREGHVTHIALGQAGDLLVIAPASANTIAKLVGGIGDNLLSITALAARCPLVLAPAMDGGMYAHPATQANVDLLRQRGAMIIGPAEGHLASGLVGPGRMEEPAQILAHIRRHFALRGPLAGRKVVVTAGGTQEAIDPVRFVTNRSSGKQGLAVVQTMLELGADVVAITGAVEQAVPWGARHVAVRSAAQMLDAVLAESTDADVLVMAAAVADFRPAQAAPHKIKKTGGIPTITLEATDDILAAVAQRRAASGFPRRCIGFAAETQDLLENAAKKLAAKQLDLIVANDITAPGAGFAVDTNQVTLLSAGGDREVLPLQTKKEVAEHIARRVISWFENQPSA